MTKIATGIQDIVPQNKPVHEIDGYVYAFYTVGGELFCQAGPVGGQLSLTNTNDTANFTGVNNNGKEHSNCAGVASDGTHIWSLLHLTGAGDRFLWVRWTPTDGVLGPPTIDRPSVNDNGTDGAMNLTPNYGGVISELYGVGLPYNQAATIRSNTYNVNADQPETGIDPPGEFPEQYRMFKLEDGYLAFSLDSGDANSSFLGANEWTKDTLGGAWTGPIDITGAGPGEFGDMSYAATESHTGQQDLTQTDDGKLWCAYVDDTAADYGSVVLRYRGSTKAGAWTTVSVDAAEADARGVALVSDGTRLMLFWIVDDGGSRGVTVGHREYDPATGAFGEIHRTWWGGSVSPKRIATDWRINGSTFPLLIQDEDDDAFLVLASRETGSSATQRDGSLAFDLAV